MMTHELMIFFDINLTYIKSIEIPVVSYQIHLGQGITKFIISCSNNTCFPWFYTLLIKFQHICIRLSDVHFLEKDKQIPLE